MRKALLAIPALLLLAPLLLLDHPVALRTTPETAKPLRLRAPAEPAKDPINADLPMMFWLEEQIAAYAFHLDRETDPETRRRLQTALDQSRADLAKRAARVGSASRQAGPREDALVLLDPQGR